jgi:O-antigen biosynthesis protein
MSSAWIEHTPFALWLIERMQPKQFVELGVQHGVSYFTFCEAIARLGLPTLSYAIDTWEGDEHTGFYGNEVFEHVNLTNAAYASFSTLIRNTFDNAVNLFADGSIDLLHIDGRHFYDDVRNDYLTYLPKLSDSAVVLFHDTNVHERGFGVAQLWKELSKKYPSFEFLHGNGLGVLRFGAKASRELDGLFAADLNPEAATLVRTVYARLGGAVSQQLALHQEKSMALHLRSDILTAKAEESAAKAEVARMRSDLETMEAEKIALNGEVSHLHLMISNLEREGDNNRILVSQMEDLNVKNALDITKLKKKYDDLLVGTSALPNVQLRKESRLPRLLRRVLSAVQRKGDKNSSNRMLRRLDDTGIFDREWYRAENPDVAASGMDPLSHFVFHGAAEGRSASAFFNTRDYLERYPDVMASGMNPLLHYLEHGAAEGRSPSPGFDAAWYTSEYPDVAKSDMNPLAHYLLHGRMEGRLPRSPELISDFDILEIGLKSGIHLDYQPLISVITPVYNIASKWLRAAVASVQSQSYLHWELCICDDGSTNAETITALSEFERSDTRIRVVRNATNKGIADATNAALALARGDFVAFLDNDDELVPHALEICVQELNDDATIDILYSDEDKIAANGSYEEPFYKPDWSPRLLREVMYIGHLLVVRRALIEENGGLDGTYDGVQDFELALRLSERARSVRHVRQILYHWRRIPGSVAEKTDAKPGLGRLQAAAVNAHLGRIGLAAQAIEHPKLQHRVVLVPRQRAKWPKVSIIIPTKDAPILIARCLDSIFEKTAYPDFEVVVVDNGSTNRRALSAIARHTVNRVDYSETFNYSRANNIGVAAANGEILVLLNNDTEVVQEDWLEQLLFFMDDPNVSVVGPRLLYPNGTVQHAGVALGMRGTADHVLRGLPADADGYFGSLVCSREVSAVTFACAMMRRNDYLAAGGLEELFHSHYQDVDMCLRLRSGGKQIVFTPHATLLHHESATRGSKYDTMDRMLLLDRWGTTVAAGDPYSRWEPETRTPMKKK